MENLSKRVLASKVIGDWILKQQQARAAAAREHRVQRFVPGMLVCVWRCGKMANHHALEKTHGVDRGRWFGPGTVLGVETVQAHGENPQPSRKVWVVMGARLWRCAPEQLRAASPREEDIFTEENGTPWTFVEALNHLNKGEVISVDKEDVPMYEE
eukprot:8043220-Pyramimonas_sp.AAC.1